MNKTLTNGGSVCYSHSLDNALEFFSKAGSLRDKGKNKKNVKDFYSNREDILNLFSKVIEDGDVEVAFKLLFWLRDCRSGAGNRSGFRKCLIAITEKYPEIVSLNIDLIPLYGRYDDLRSLFYTKAHQAAVQCWGKAIQKKDSLACKWADRSDKPLFAYMQKYGNLHDIGEFRRWLAEGRKNITERKMCANQWNEIDYSKVPSKCMAMNTNAFKKHDEKRFQSYKDALVKGETKVNAGALFPHDCALTAINGDGAIADAQFEALPNFMEGTTENIMCLCDSSGSMDSPISGSTRAIHISTALSLYCSDRVGKSNPFYRKFMEFESESKLKDWTDKKFSECYKYSVSFFNGAYGATNIHKALDTILHFAQMYKATNDQIPSILLIISDMQFHPSRMGYEDTVIENCMKKWETAGYKRPKILYWNVMGYAGNLATKHHENVGLVSGFSPSILKSVLSGKDFTPVGIMKETLNKYVIKMS